MHVLFVFEHIACPSCTQNHAPDMLLAQEEEKEDFLHLHKAPFQHSLYKRNTSPLHRKMYFSYNPKMVLGCPPRAPVDRSYAPNWFVFGFRQIWITLLGHEMEGAWCQYWRLQACANRTADSVRLRCDALRCEAWPRERAPPSLTHFRWLLAKAAATGRGA